MPGTVDPRVRQGFASAQELYAYARADGLLSTLEPAVLQQMARIAFHKYERTYPTEQELNAQCNRAAARARAATSHLSDEEVADWFDAHNQQARAPNFADLTFMDRDDRAASNRVRAQSALMPISITDMNEPERMLCIDRYGQYELPTGEIVLPPVEKAYCDVLLARRDRGKEQRAARRAAAAARENVQVRATLEVISNETRKTKERRAAKQRRVRVRWHKAIRAVIRQNRADAAASAENAAANEAQRRVRAQAAATAAAKQPRAYTAAGPSHKEGAAKWEDEPPTAAEAAKREVAKAASLEAKAAAIAAKKEAEARATAERLEQLRCLHVAEEIGGSH